MNRIVPAAVAFLLGLAPASWSQQSPPPPVPPAGGSDLREPLSPSAEARGPRVQGPRLRGEQPEAPPRSKSAEFRFKRGDLEMQILCDEDESIKPCADAALTLMDKFGSVAATLPEPSPPPSP